MSEFDGEAKFWTGVLQDEASGWDLAAQADLLKNDGLFGKVDAFMYLVDAASGWTIMGGLQWEDLVKAADQQLGSVTSDAAKSAAAQAIVDCARKKAGTNDHATKGACKLGAAAIVQTQTFDIVLKQLSTCKGHWLWLVYTAKDGSLISRPGFLSNQAGRGPLTVATVNEWVRAVHAMDSKPSTNLGKALLEGGGMGPVASQFR